MKFGRSSINAKKNLIVTSIVLTILAVLLVAGMFYFRLKDRNNIDLQLVEVDRLIKIADYEKAESIVERVSRNLPDRYKTYRVLKRAINLSELSGDYTLFKHVAKSGVEQFSGNEDLHAYYVKALIECGELQLAKEIAEKNLNSSEYKSLLAEAILKADNQDIITLTEYVNSHKNPAFFEYLAHLLNSDELLINAALLWASSGDLEKAYSIVNTLSRQYPELDALITYDSGRRSEALLKLLELPHSDALKVKNRLIIADLFYSKENWSRSRFYYEEVLKDDPLNLAAYINLSSIYLKNGSVKQSISTVEHGRSNYSNMLHNLILEVEGIRTHLEEAVSIEEKNLQDKLLNIKEKSFKEYQSAFKELSILSYNLYKEIDESQSMAILQQYRDLFPEDVKIELMQLRATDMETNPEILIAKLWRLINRDDDNRDVSEFLVWYLLGIENYDDISLILERTENRHPNETWTTFYYGVIEALDGSYLEAKSDFEGLPGAEKDWVVLYNRGVIEMALGNFSEALNLFNRSTIAIGQKDFLSGKSRYLSQIKTKSAQVLIALNDEDEAIRLLNSAYNLDPDNYTSDLLKSLHMNLKDSL